MADQQQIKEKEVCDHFIAFHERLKIHEGALNPSQTLASQHWLGKLFPNTITCLSRSADVYEFTLRTRVYIS